jgi:hypothetical protein
MPSLMVSKDSSKVAVYWYDRRAATDPNFPQVEIYRRSSTDRGVTWGSNVLVSDVNSPTGPASIPCDALGDYNRGGADEVEQYLLWADRRTQGSTNNSNVFFERVNAGFCTTNFCAGAGTRCVMTGSSEACCTYQSVADDTCVAPDLVPSNACPCATIE